MGVRGETTTGRVLQLCTDMCKGLEIEESREQSEEGQEQPRKRQRCWAMKAMNGRGFIQVQQDGSEQRHNHIACYAYCPWSKT